jgi:hypothetical protein
VRLVFGHVLLVCFFFFFFSQEGEKHYKKPLFWVLLCIVKALDSDLAASYQAELPGSVPGPLSRPQRTTVDVRGVRSQWPCKTLSLSLSLSLVSVSLPFLFVLFCFRGILFFFPSRYTYVYAFKWLCLFSEKYGKIERNCNVGSFILSFVIWHPSKQKYSLFTLSLSV